MKKINPTTQQAKHFIRAYNFHVGTNKGENLYEIYTRYSYKKEKALTYCKELKNQYHGFNACFCGKNTDYFTYAFLFTGLDGKTYLAYITYANDYCVLYEE